MNNKMNAVKRDEMTRRTVYVSDIDQQVRGLHPHYSSDYMPRSCPF